ncbi:HIT-like protein [Terfezia boudieri ATCC MYA-4762]|uniref:HIT-like protein n=1 Tax=Terfezia boudieri ATCC MYA-4762 TaxID=1051890 RepID=A0A3N4M457_9PEZI|nr:HIT-like protein [Terfezia boudieri ATCC MYA-4762]
MLKDGDELKHDLSLTSDASPTESDVIHPSELTEPPATSEAPLPKNAFSVLLSSSKDLSKKRPLPPSSSTDPPDPTKRTHPPNWRGCLLPYLTFPHIYPPTTVLRHTPSFVTIFDAFPKATIHLLLLPRDPTVNTLHPILALNTHPSLLSSSKSEVQILTPLVQKELRRRFGHLSKTQIAHTSSPDTVPERIYPLKIGIHAHPSLTHLHIHIITPDMSSPSLKHNKHYNSFTTPFFIPLEDFPMAEDDYRRKHPGRDEESGEVYLKGDMRCWRCGRNFGNKFKALKEHLEKEKEEWLAE